MDRKLDRYVRPIVEALSGRNQRTRGRQLIAYVGHEDLQFILRYGYDNGHLEPSPDGGWRFMNCELVQVRKDEWFELGWQGFVA